MSEFRTASEALDEAYSALTGCSSSAVLRSLAESDSLMLGPAMAKFSKRLNEIDPATGAARYGPSMKAKVSSLLERHAAFQSALNNDVSSAGGLLEVLLAKEGAAAAEAAESAKEAQASAAASQASLAAAKLAAEQEHKAREAAAAEEARVREEQARREKEERERAAAEESRRRQEEEARAYRQWIDSINVSAAGLRVQLQAIKTVSLATKQEATVALRALHVLFSQIVKNPEEPKFRRVKVAHPKFEADIGRWAGGKEALVAGGWTGTSVDGEKCMVLVEPDLERDFDGWSKWFNYLKECVAVIEEEVAAFR